ncbi:hypothetical protein NKI86_25450 [Mesorhizobium sp. M0320]|uniref:SGNH hydrolase domain-containing protein n=1 Tax=Mesorhizobium sp. M0320 TaxID=2956936 RepID=UPI0033397368
MSAKLGYKVKLREINPEAVVHPTVDARFEFSDVPQCAGFGPYRPQAPRNHKKFAHFYIDLTNQFCDAKTCHVFINGKIAYRDQHHLATPFAETLEPAVEKPLF